MFALQKGQIGSGNGGALGVVGPLWLFQKRGIKEKAWRRGQRREWEEFEVLDGRMKKFPLKRAG